MEEEKEEVREMNKMIITLIVSAFLLTTFALPTFAACSMCGTKPAATEKIVNKECPVMGGRVDKDTPYTLEHKGKRIGFCCASCVDAFDANPENYEHKLEKVNKQQKT